MTPDEIETAAIEAARKAVDAFWKTVEQDQHDIAQHEADRIFIRAYEAAMWRPISKYKSGEQVIFLTNEGRQFVGTGQMNAETGAGLFGVSGTGSLTFGDDITHFRPLPARGGE